MGKVVSGLVGGGLAHENRPPYLALAYIMKT
jgi:microcystin-dependent protein